MEQRNDAAARAKVFDLIKDIKVAMLATHAAGGHMHARPMAAVRIEAFDGEVWFFTDNASRKVDEVMSEESVLLTYADPDRQHYVSIDGTAFTVTDKAKIHQLWSEGMRTWFPKGPDDPGIALLRVTVDSAEYWDAPSSTMVYAYGYLKALATGERPHPGENAAVRF